LEVDGNVTTQIVDELVDHTQSSSSTDMEVDNDESIKVVQESVAPTQSSSTTDMENGNVTTQIVHELVDHTQSSSSTDMEVDNDESIKFVQESVAPSQSSSTTDMEVDNDDSIKVDQESVAQIQSSTSSSMEVINDEPIEIVQEPNAPTDPLITEEVVLNGIICPICTAILTSCKPSLLFRTNIARKAPIIAKCSECKSNFTHVSLRKASTNILLQLSSYTQSDMKKDVRQVLSRPEVLPIPENLPQEELSAIKSAVKSYILDKREANQNSPEEPFTFDNTLTEPQKQYIKDTLQYSGAVRASFEHKYEHHGSCFKKGKEHGCRFCYCRYSYPHDVQECTRVGCEAKKHDDDEDYDSDDDDADDQLRMKRTIGCEYINPRCDTLFLMTLSNSDVKVILGRPNVYSTKYTTKGQDRVDTNVVLDKFSAMITRSFKKRALVEEEHPEMDDKTKAQGRMLSFLYHYTSLHEIANTMAIFYVLTNSMPFFQSHDYTNLMLVSGIATANNVQQVHEL
jgi:hypothetical protein